MATMDSSTDHHFLHIESLPLIDLRLLSQSELYSLSLCSSSHIHRRCDDDAIIPRIDRSVFNESAGSRKQTFSRLRLAPRNNQISSVSASTIQIPRHNPEPTDEENAQILGILQQLFGVESYDNDKHDDDSLVSVQVEFQNPLPESGTVAFQNIPIDIVDEGQRKRRRGRPRKNENVGIRVEEKPKKEGGQAMTMVNNNGILVDAVALVNVEDPFGEELKRRTLGFETESATVAFQNIPVDIVDEGQRKRKRGRPRKNENVGIGIEEKPKKEVDEEMTMVNNDGVLVDAVALVNVEDPFGEELKRRTLGLETESQLLEFMGRLNGEWGSQRKKRRIVQASDFGDLLPRGWKIMLSLKRRGGHVSIICRRYISPDGHQFVSCKEVSSYLLSFFGLQNRSHSKSRHTGGSLQFSSKMAYENGVGYVPTRHMEAVDVASSLHIPSTSVYTDHEKQATISSSIGSDKKNISDENVINDLASATKIQGDNTTSGMFTDFYNQGSLLFKDERPSKADKNDTVSVEGCFPQEDRVCDIDNEKLVDVNEVHDAACKLDVPLAVTASFSSNKNNGDCDFLEDINAVNSMKSGIRNFISQNGNAGCSEIIPCGSVVESNGYELPVRLVEDPGQQIGFESGMLDPSSEGKKCAGDRLEDMNISDGKSFENDKWLNISGNDHSETEDVLTSFRLHSGYEGSSLVTSKNELKHASINGMNSIGVVDIAPNVTVTKDYCDNNFCDNHAPHNEDAVTSFAQETSSLNEQSFNCKLDNPLSISLGSPTGNEHFSAFDNNANVVSSGTLEALKTVEAGCKNPQLDIVSCSNDAALDAYATTSIMEGRSQGCVSVPFSSIPNQFDEQGHDGVNNANKFCLTKKAKGEQVELCENDEAFFLFGGNQIESDVDVMTNAVHGTMFK